MWFTETLLESACLHKSDSPSKPKFTAGRLFFAIYMWMYIFSNLQFLTSSFCPKPCIIILLCFTLRNFHKKLNTSCWSISPIAASKSHAGARTACVFPRAEKISRTMRSNYFVTVPKNLSEKRCLQEKYPTFFILFHRPIMSSLLLSSRTLT